MDPPSYEIPATAAATQSRSIQDLRAQIIANGSVMRPRANESKPSNDHIELVVAKTPAFTSSQAARSTHWTEKQALAMASDGTKSFITPDANRPTSSTSSTQPGKHYAVLMRRGGGGSKTVRIIVQGEPQDTIEEALEWMLERTEMATHDMIVRHGQPDTQGCSVM